MLTRITHGTHLLPHKEMRPRAFAGLFASVLVACTSAMNPPSHARHLHESPQSGHHAEQRRAGFETWRRDLAANKHNVEIAVIAMLKYEHDVERPLLAELRHVRDVHPATSGFGPSNYVHSGSERQRQLATTWRKSAAMGRKERERLAAVVRQIGRDGEFLEWDLRRLKALFSGEGAWETEHERKVFEGIQHRVLWLQGRLKALETAAAEPGPGHGRLNEQAMQRRVDEIPKVRAKTEDYSVSWGSTAEDHDALFWPDGRKLRPIWD